MTQAARTLAVLMCKHEYDARYQTLDDKLYISQRYFPIVTHVSTDLWLALFILGIPWYITFYMLVYVADDEGNCCSTTLMQSGYSISIPHWNFVLFLCYALS